MNESQRLAMGMARRSTVVLLPRDTETAYVYWEWPGAEASGGPALLTLFKEGEGGAAEEIERFEVFEAMDGRFLRFGSPGARHRCELSWPGKVERSDWLAAPRSEAGDGPLAFVRVALTPQGLQVEPTEHYDPIHGHFPAAKGFKRSSRPLGSGGR